MEKGIPGASPQSQIAISCLFKRSTIKAPHKNAADVDGEKLATAILTKARMEKRERGFSFREEIEEYGRAMGDDPEFKVSTGMGKFLLTSN